MVVHVSVEINQNNGIRRQVQKRMRTDQFNAIRKRIKQARGFPLHRLK